MRMTVPTKAIHKEGSMGISIRAAEYQSGQPSPGSDGKSKNPVAKNLEALARTEAWNIGPILEVETQGLRQNRFGGPIGT
ncbi:MULTISPECIES: hypothetical protein [Mesorhizobium]|uniref:hypothetical protein n=1 Tax=Mesorhizobium TaxID=68287 RepID=UPI0018DCF79A|nr:MULTISPECIES: hypothetical protein [Mesorhizobium]WJI39119.1 hypothetical protein NL534_02295 [Mesorhizobium opportunistum]